MSLFEFLGLLALGLPVGALMIGVFSGEERARTRKVVARFCLKAGLISTAFLLVAALAGVDIVLTKSILGMAFIGLPALPAGLLLHLYSLRVHGRNETDPSDIA
jgi:hypothetical protein